MLWNEIIVEPVSLAELTDTVKKKDMALVREWNSFMQKEGLQKKNF